MKKLIEEHENLAFVLTGLLFMAVASGIHWYIASAPPWKFLLFLIDPGKTAPLFASEKYWKAYVVGLSNLSYLGWIGIWSGITGCLWGPVCRSWLLWIAAGSVLLAPLAVVYFVWTASWVIRASALLVCSMAVAAYLATLVILGLIHPY